MPKFCRHKAMLQDGLSVFSELCLRRQAIFENKSFEVKSSL
jgi:hypothetical protein